MGKSAGLAVVAVLAVAALGAGIYTIYNQLTAVPAVNQKVVGLWEQLSINRDYAPHNTATNCMVNASQTQVLNGEYVVAANQATTFLLVKAGWYRVSVALLYTNIEASSTYWTELYVDGQQQGFFDRHETSGTLDSSYHSVHGQIAIYSSGQTNVSICIYSSVGADIYISGDIKFNQLVIEYLAV